MVGGIPYFALLLGPITDYVQLESRCRMILELAWDRGDDLVKIVRADAYTTVEMVRGSKTGSQLASHNIQPGFCKRCLQGF